MAARNKNVRREWVVFCFHCCELGLNITYRRSESFQCILQDRVTTWRGWGRLANCSPDKTIVFYAAFGRVEVIRKLTDFYRVALQSSGGIAC
jgi:hypothetical protein